MEVSHCDSQHLERLRLRFNAGEQLRYVFFWGHRAGKHGVTKTCFSQWYEAPFEVDGERFLTAEHYMMAEKAALFGDCSAREQVLRAPTAAAAKTLGRQVEGFNEQEWIAQRFAIVVRGNRAKFAQHPECQRVLKETGTGILVEASPVDRIWGIGLAQDDERASDPNLWPGLNLLGFALMQIRDEILDERARAS